MSVAAYSCCCCCCLTGWIVRTILTILALFGLTVLLFFIAANPQKMKAHVTHASLTQFDLNEVNETMLFNLEFNLSIRNPNRIVGFFYDDFPVRAFHQGSFMDSWWMRFYQPRKNTTEMKFELVGEQQLYFQDGSGELSRFKARFDAQKSARVFDIDVEVDLLVRAKIGKVRVGIFQPKIRCGLKIPLTSIEKRKSGSTGFNATECGVEFKADSIFEPLD